MDDEEKGKDEEEGYTGFCFDVAAQEALVGQNQNSPLLKPLSPRATGDHSHPRRSREEE